MEVYFADVGQGTCNVILLGRRRAIVIDTGRRAADLRLLLNDLAVDALTVLAISHLDADHAGGAPAMLTQFRGRIETVCYPNDHRLEETPFWKKLEEELGADHIHPDQLVRMEYEKTPKTLWKSASLKVELKIFSPTFGENQEAIRSQDANATSGVLVLKVCDRRIVFPGDSSTAQWRKIREVRGLPLDCEAIAVPHHAGIIWPNHWDAARREAELEWLYTDGVQPGVAIISVGTSNSDGHPREDVVKTLRKLEVPVLCTQITEQCHADPESLRPGVIPLVVRGRATAKTIRTSSGNCKDVACAGTVVAEITPAAFTVRRLTQHQSAVDVLPGGAKKPLCRKTIPAAAASGS